MASGKKFSGSIRHETKISVLPITLFALLAFVLMDPHGVQANEIRHNPELAKKLISRFNDAFKETVTIKESDYEKFKQNFVDYYLEEVVPRLDHIADFIASDAHAFIDIDEDGKEEFIVWSEGLKPSAWGARDFIAVLSRGQGSWQMVAIKLLNAGISIKCSERRKCRFAWARYNPPVGPNNQMGGMLTYANYGVSGHTFWIETVRYNRFNEQFEIVTSSSAYPLIIDQSWKY